MQSCACCFECVGFVHAVVIIILVVVVVITNMWIYYAYALSCTRNSFDAPSVGTPIVSNRFSKRIEYARSVPFGFDANVDVSTFHRNENQTHMTKPHSH